MFFNNYSKPGKGVNKRNPDQPRIQVFFDVLPRKLWDLFKLNILYLLTMIPFFIVTMFVVGVISAPLVEAIATELANTELVYMDIVLRFIFAFLFMLFLGEGPATAGYTYIIREHGREHPCWLISDFFERVKSNFKQGILLWIIGLVGFIFDDSCNKILWTIRDDYTTIRYDSCSCIVCNDAYICVSDDGNI